MFGRMFSVFNPGTRGGTIAPQPITIFGSNLRTSTLEVTYATLRGSMLNNANQILFPGTVNPGAISWPLLLFARMTKDAPAGDTSNLNIRFANGIGSGGVLNLLTSNCGIGWSNAGAIQQTTLNSNANTFGFSAMTSNVDFRGVGLNLTNTTAAMIAGPTGTVRLTLMFAVVRLA